MYQLVFFTAADLIYLQIRVQIVYVQVPVRHTGTTVSTGAVRTYSISNRKYRPTVLYGPFNGIHWKQKMKSSNFVRFFLPA